MRKDLKTTAIVHRWTFMSLLVVMAFCLSTPTYGQISKDDFEIVTREFNDMGEYSYAYFELLKLNVADTPQKQRLKVFLDSLLYDGMTIEAYLKKWKREISEMGQGSYNETFKWDVIGKYLRINRSSSGCGASCNGHDEYYIIDTHALKHLSRDELFVNSNGAEFTKLILKHFRRSERYNEVDKNNLNQSLKDKNYGISFEKDGIGFHWDKYQLAAGIAGDFYILIPRSEVEPYMTQAGKESSRFGYNEPPSLQKIFEDVVKRAKEGSLYDYSGGSNVERYKTYLKKYPLSDANLVIYNDMGYYLEQAKAYAAAIYLLRAVLEKYPQRIVAHLNIADAYWGNGEPEKAKKHYEEYVRLMKSQNKDMSKIPQRVYDRIKSAAP
jgi:tetratricopeptide (TPR) repeat protein